MLALEGQQLRQRVDDSCDLCRIGPADMHIAIHPDLAVTGARRDVIGLFIHIDSTRGFS